MIYLPLLLHLKEWRKCKRKGEKEFIQSNSPFLCCLVVLIFSLSFDILLFLPNISLSRFINFFFPIFNSRLPVTTSFESGFFFFSVPPPHSSQRPPPLHFAFISSFFAPFFPIPLAILFHPPHFCLTFVMHLCFLFFFAFSVSNLPLILTFHSFSLLFYLSGSILFVFSTNKTQTSAPGQPAQEKVIIQFFMTHFEQANR